MIWYLRSINDGDAHRGGMSRGTVHTACGIQFLPLRRKDAAKVPDNQRCLECGYTDPTRC